MTKCNIEIQPYMGPRIRLCFKSLLSVSLSVGRGVCQPGIKGWEACSTSIPFLHTSWGQVQLFLFLITAVDHLRLRQSGTHGRCSAPLPTPPVQSPRPPRRASGHFCPEVKRVRWSRDSPFSRFSDLSPAVPLSVHASHRRVRPLGRIRTSPAAPDISGASPARP